MWRAGNAEGLLGVHPRDERRDHQRRQEHAHPRAERQAPPQRGEQEPEIARVADGPVDARRDERMPRLDGHQAAEAATEHEDRPEPQQAARDVDGDAGPADGIPVDGPGPRPVGVVREIGLEQTDHPEGGEDPAVAAVLALAGAEVAAAEERRDGQGEGHGRQDDAGRVGEEGGEPAPAEDGEGEVSDCPQQGRGRHLEGGHRGGFRIAFGLGESAGLTPATRPAALRSPSGRGRHSRRHASPR